MHGSQTVGGRGRSMNTRPTTHERWSAASNETKGKFFEFVIQGLIDAHCPKGGCTIDIGANWGSHTYVMLEAAGSSGVVLAFEPDPRLAALLTNWRERFTNLTVIQIALSDHDGEAQFFVAEETGYNTLNREVSERTKVANTLAVQLRRLDDVPEVAALTPHIVKIDVEGEELRVLFGAETTIRRTRPIIIAEIDWKFLFRGEGKPSEEILFDWLEGLCPGGYRMFNFFGDPVTGFDWDAWNVVMLPHGHPETEAVLRTVEDSGRRFFELDGSWDPMKRFRDGTAAAGLATAP